MAPGARRPVTDRLDVVREFIKVLQLHREHPADVVAQAIRQALAIGCAHPVPNELGRYHDGVSLCLRQLLQPETAPPPLDLKAFPRLVGVGEQPLELAHYDLLLAGS